MTAWTRSHEACVDWTPLTASAFNHHLTDAHRYNVKRRLATKVPATEAQFQSLMEDLELSSISGSGSSDSDEGEEDDGSDGDNNGGNGGLRRRKMLLSLPEEEEREDEAAGGNAGSTGRGAAAISHALQVPQFVFQAAGGTS